MFGPFASNGFGVEESLSLQTRSAEQRLGPLPQRATQPFVNRNSEAGLRPIHQSGRNVLMQDFPQQPFTSAAANLHAQRQLPRELEYAVIQEGDTGFQT